MPAVKAHLERFTLMDWQALIMALSISGAVLAARGPASVSWVPYQIGCPILVADLKTEANVHALLFESIDVQNVSAEAVDQVTVGVLAGSQASGIPRRLVASQTMITSIAAGERRRLSLQLDVRADVPTTARPDDFLITLGVVQVRDRSGAAWVSPVAISGEFKAVNWASTQQAQSRQACMDGRRRQYPPGAVVFDQRDVAQICRPDGTWAPR